VPDPTIILRAVLADITELDVECVVNAANTTLLGGGGVDGAIHDAAGPELFEVCERLGGCDVGDAKITPGFKLKARYIIHAVGPIWRGGSHGEAQLLAACYRRSFELAAKDQITSIAFPSISTGAFGYPIELAAPVAISEARSFASRQIAPRDIIFCCFSSEDFDLYMKLLD